MPGSKRKSDEKSKESGAAKKTKKFVDESGEGVATTSLVGLDFSAGDFTTADSKTWNIKVSSWNVNGLRAWMKKGGIEYVVKENPDIFCLQETKCSEKAIPAEASISGYHVYWLSGDTEGYSGVGLFSKAKPLSVKYGIDVDKHDKEGRVITAEYEKFYLVGAYVPNAGKKLVRLDYRQTWDEDFRKYLKNLDDKKPVVLCGDLNVSHKEIDLARPKNNHRNAGFTDEEREGFTELLDSGFTDAYRHFYPDKANAYTFWTFMMNSRAKDVGWRLDYFAVSNKLVENLRDCIIRKSVMGSDHCPIVLLLSV